MFKSRPLLTPSVTAEPPLPMVQIVADCQESPLQDNWGERWCTLPKTFEDVIEGILNLEVRADDVYIETFMKCGTNWMQEAAWMLMNNLDSERAKKEMNKSFFIDMAGLFAGKAHMLAECNDASGPRLFKTHMPVNLLPKQLWLKKPKIIYVARNVKDVVVSAYHFVKGLGMWNGSLDEFVTDFMNDAIVYTPFWAHIVDFWKLRDEPYIFFVTYEEMKRDLAGVLQRLCTFLERPQLTEEQLAKTVHHLDFATMKANEVPDLPKRMQEKMPTKIDKNFKFLRRGIVGSYKDELLPEQQQKLDAWSRKILAQYGLKPEDIFEEH